MKKLVIALIGLAVALSLLVVVPALQAAEPNKPKIAHKNGEISVIGTVNVTKDDSGNITAINIKTARLDTFNITINDKAKEMAASFAGKNVRATCIIETKDGARWLTVEKYQEMVAQPAIKPLKPHEPNKPK